MQYFLLSLHILIGVLLIIIVLLQQSKGGGLAGSFGGAGAGEAFFGARGVMTILHKATIVLGTAFMLSSLLLIVTSATGSGGGSRLSQQAAQQSAPLQAPVTAQPGADASLTLPPVETTETPDDAATGDAEPVEPADDGATADTGDGGETP